MPNQETIQTAQGTAAGTQPGATPAASSTVSDSEAKLLKEVMAYKAKLQKFEADEAKRNADAAKAAEDEARKKGEYEKLLTERDAKLTALELRVKKQDEATTARISAKLETIPEASRESIKSAIEKIPDIDARESALDGMLAAFPGAGAAGTGAPSPKPGSPVSADAEIEALKKQLAKEQNAFKRIDISSRIATLESKRRI